MIERTFNILLKRGRLGVLSGSQAKIISIDGQEQPPIRIQYSKYRRARQGFSINRDFMTRPVKFVSEDEDASS